MPLLVQEDDPAGLQFHQLQDQLQRGVQQWLEFVRAVEMLSDGPKNLQSSPRSLRQFVSLYAFYTFLHRYTLPTPGIKRIERS